jgi:hypothetical protein
MEDLTKLNTRLIFANIILFAGIIFEAFYFNYYLKKESKNLDKSN